ncbi:LysR family transcriptional regulator ArgP [Leptothrix discophora]|uniref:LysR family transcriptional regulator ArgP n=1 Tax=Leptothrix discophora TaxID=89 RepID=A0ABT9G6A3_LEPDI|nr:LysR family transcriptional regulator ArgP [Leptothrix discophora]MDP4302007.1 LysR family transcriptional regulator ArgP [Leptothrix discophora]
MLDLQALRALAAVLREGSFERAARQMHVTPSAVSQRIRALEEKLGCVLLVRTSPVTATEEGARLYLHFLQIEVLESDLARDLQPLGDAASKRGRSIRVAVNADSLATWVIPALADFHARSGDTVAIHVDDQEHTREWLRSGTVFAAVTASADPVAGCRVDPLGSMRYHALASPDFHQRHFEGRDLQAAFAEAPMLVYNQKDQLQHRFLSELLGDVDPHPPVWWLPSTHAFMDAARAGLGWGLHPLPLVAEDIASGRLVDLSPGHSVDVPLYWQSWRLDSETVHTLRACVLRAAEGVLQQ